MDDMERGNGHWYSEVAGLNSLNEGQAVEYEIESNRGKESAMRLKIK